MKGRALIARFSLTSLSAGPPPKPIEFPSGLGEEALVVPAASPVRFLGYGKNHEGRFRGRFVLSGTFFYGCEIECEPPLQKGQVFAAIVPDPAVAAKLPHWKLRDNGMRIFLVNGERLASRIVNRSERAAILVGKLENVRRRVTIVVDDFRATIDCDSAFYSARFVAIAKPVQLARTRLDGNYGCG